MAGESTSGGDAQPTSTRTLLTSTKIQAIRPEPQTPVVLRIDCTVDHALKVSMQVGIQRTSGTTAKNAALDDLK